MTGQQSRLRPEMPRCLDLRGEVWTRLMAGPELLEEPPSPAPAPLAPPPRSPGAGAETAGRLRRDSSHYLYVNMFVNSCTVFLGGGRGRVRNYK